MADTIDHQFVEFIVKSLVNNPDQVRVERTIDEKGVLLELHVSPEDLGRVIGRGGATAKSIRTLLRALGVKNDARYNLKVVDTGSPAPRDRAPQDNYQSPPREVSHETVAVAETQPMAEVETVETETIETDEPVFTETEDEPVVAAAPEEDDMIARNRKEIDELTDFDI